MKDLFANFGRIKKNDPEFHEIFENFAYGEVFEYSTLSEKESILETTLDKSFTVIPAISLSCKSDNFLKP